MEEKEVYVVNTSRKNPLPKYQTALSAGCDLYAHLDEEAEITIGPGESARIGTGISTVIPDGFAIWITPRSGLAFKNQITVLNSPGTIDGDYRDELGVILINHGRKAFVVKDGDRIAQAILIAVSHIKWIEVDKLSDVSNINRGGGFGSTGV